MLSATPKLLSGIEDSHHGPSDAMHNPSQPFKVEKTLVSKLTEIHSFLSTFSLRNIRVSDTLCILDEDGNLLESNSKQAMVGFEIDELMKLKCYCFGILNVFLRYEDWRGAMADINEDGFCRFLYLDFVLDVAPQCYHSAAYPILGVLQMVPEPSMKNMKRPRADSNNAVDPESTNMEELLVPDVHGCSL
ncbi:hypothetical protein Tco_0965572 [Tanacetum coccineum]